MNKTYLQNFKNRLNNNFHISLNKINKIRNTYPLVYKNKESFLAFKNQILINQVKTLYKIQNDNQEEIVQLQSNLKNTDNNIQLCFQNILSEDKDFKHTYQYYQKVIEKKNNI